MYGLIFDVDGVLADTEALSAEATMKMYRDLYGVEVHPEDFQPFVGTGAVRYVEGPAEKYGIDIDTSRAVAERHKNFLALLESGRDISFPGAHDLIQAAHADNQWKLARATSRPGEKSRATLEAARLDPGRFNAWIHGDLVGKKKPDPEIYTVAAEEIGLMPTVCVVVEDALTGIEAAKAAGMTCVAVTNSFPRHKLGQADLVVDSLAEVRMEALYRLVEGAPV